MPQGAEDLEPSLETTVRIWWSFFWRTVVLGSIGGLVFGVFSAFLAQLMGFDPGSVGAFIFITAFVIAGIPALREALRIRYQDIRITVTRRYH